MVGTATYVVMVFRDRLRWAREASGVSQRELSEIAGLSPSHVWALETEHAKLKRGLPDVGTVSALARVLGVTLDWLVDGAGEKPNADDIIASVKKAKKASERAAQRTGT